MVAVDLKRVRYLVSHPLTLYRWLNAEELTPKRHGLRNRKIDKKALKKHVEEHPDMFLHERAEEFGVNTSSKPCLKDVGDRKKKNADIMSHY